MVSSIGALTGPSELVMNVFKRPLPAGWPGLKSACVDLVDVGFACELHLAGVVLAGRNFLKPLKRDVYLVKVDRH
jgi:hypothetical protein